MAGCQNQPMLRAVLSIARAWLLALLFGCALLLQGCSLLPKKEAAEPASMASLVPGGDQDKGQRDAFSVEVHAPDAVRTYLVRHLEIQRYHQLDELGATEISRLMVAAEANARELLGTLGYFTPTLTLELRETPASSKAPREVAITVEPGEVTHVRDAHISFSGPIESDPAAQAQRSAIRQGWTLHPGQPFSQSAWDKAKSNGLRALTAKRYPTGSVAASQARIDADRHAADLEINYLSGPAYRFGLLQVRGNERYDPDGARRIARLPTGADYEQQTLLDAQQRLASSGYYDSVFLTLETHGTDPQWAPVIAQVREAPLQKVVLGVGVTTDSGARVSVDHTHNQLPWLGWRAVSKLSLDRNARLLRSEWNAIPDDGGWRWFGGGELKRETSGSYLVASGRLRGGRSQSTGHIDRNYFLQYDYAQNVGLNAPPSASSLSLNWGWTGRYFDSDSSPTRGYGLAVELGAGYTLTGTRQPYTRTYVRWFGIVPLGTVQADDGTSARGSRLALRAEAGAVVAKDAAQIPATQMFLTGGDTTVRGYAYRQIGSETAAGQIVAGRYLAVTSAEWQRPFVYQGRMTAWESTVFIDAGAVADKPGALKPQVGVGVGARWRSPFGPLQIDLAYGVAVKKFRLHFRLGFTF